VIPESAQHHHEEVDPHRRARALSDVILGGQDGVVNVLGVLLGVAAAGAPSRIILAAGLATTFAESISMAAVAYTSRLADADVYRSEREREYRHITRVPELERAEVRALYARKGFEGDLLDRVVDTITANKDVWVAVMMAEEHGLAPISRREALRAAFVVGLSAVIGSLVPVMPFSLLDTATASVASVAIAALTLFAVGAYKARLTVGHPARSGLELALIGTASALAGYAVGLLFRAPTVP
jgi:VIT1/CCC1 family predicted Fe2+/Mn2+ transporter